MISLNEEIFSPKHFVINHQNSCFLATNCQNINFLGRWYFLMHNYLHNNAKNWQNSCLYIKFWNFLAADNFLRAQYFSQILYSLKVIKIHDFLWPFRNIIIPTKWYFLNVPLFCLIMLWYHRKLAKFRCNCQNMNFLSGWCF